MISLDTEQAAEGTLAERLAEGRLPAREALRYAMMLANKLVKMHGRGRAHGAVSPANIVLGLELRPDAPAPYNVTPYTAPEVVSGLPAGPASDVFSFAALLYEMLTGRRAFAGGGAGEMAESILGAAPVPSGIPALDRLMAMGLAKDPSARCQSMDELLPQLERLAAEGAAADASPLLNGGVEAALRAEMQALEERITSRLAAHKKSVTESGHAVTDALKALRGQLAAVSRELAVRSGGDSPGAVDRLMARAEEGRKALADRMSRLEQSLGKTADRVTRVEQGLDTIRQRTAEVHEAIDEDVLNFENMLTTHSSSIDSARNAIAQTDELLERVVEALEVLQSTVLDPAEDRLLPVN